MNNPFDNIHDYYYSCYIRVSLFFLLIITYQFNSKADSDGYSLHSQYQLSILCAFIKEGRPIVHVVE